VPLNLQAYGIAAYFGTVITSSGLGWRKPNPRIFYEAARSMELPPAACAYVGDTISRDVIGARRAGYGMTIQIRSFLTAKSDEAVPSNAEQPDAVIRDLTQVVGLVTRDAR
jgi:putative hydrolase of the HAD superfamily